MSSYPYEDQSTDCFDSRPQLAEIQVEQENQDQSINYFYSHPQLVEIQVEQEYQDQSIYYFDSRPQLVEIQVEQKYVNIVNYILETLRQQDRNNVQIRVEQLDRKVKGQQQHIYPTNEMTIRKHVITFFFTAFYKVLQGKFKNYIEKEREKNAQNKFSITDLKFFFGNKCKYQNELTTMWKHFLQTQAYNQVYHHLRTKNDAIREKYLKYSICLRKELDQDIPYKGFLSKKKLSFTQEVENEFNGMI